MRFSDPSLSYLLLLVSVAPCFLHSQGFPPAENADSLFFSAQRFQRAGDLNSAKREVRYLLSRSPDYHDARVLYGRLCAWEGDYQLALVQFDSVLTARPDHQEAKLAKAQVLSWMRRYRQAVELLQSLVEDSPTSALYLYELGRVYWMGGAPRKGLEYYELAYLQDPMSQEIIRGLARVHRQLRSHELSLYWYRKLLAKVPNDPEALSEVFRQTYRADHEVVLQWSEEVFTKQGFDNHRVASLEYYLSLSEDWKPFLHLSRVVKFSQEDNRFGIGSYVTASYFVSLFTQLIVSPNADAVPRLEAHGELSYGFGAGIEGVLGYRFLSFDSTRVHVLSPGVSAYANQDLWLTPRVYIGLSDVKPASTSWTLTLNYRHSPSTLLRIGGFTGTETFRATTLSEISGLKSNGGFISFKSRLFPMTAIETMYQYTSRNISSNSHQFTLAVSFFL